MTIQMCTFLPPSIPFSSLPPSLPPSSPLYIEECPTELLETPFSHLSAFSLLYKCGMHCVHVVWGCLCVDMELKWLHFPYPQQVSFPSVPVLYYILKDVV